ncbi:MAG: AtpZ/AtpI family protein [Acidimicrobiia bacterium]|nr:AtpZ/AtpI family protein [Acidimicrobiia bacterium]
MVLGSEATVFDLSAKRELNNGFGNSMSTAVELVVSPILMGLLGWWIDRQLGTFPLFALALFLVTLGYIVWKQFAVYAARMDRQQQELLAPTIDRERA